MPLVDDMEAESAIPRRVQQAPETVSLPCFTCFPCDFKKIRVHPCLSTNCQLSNCNAWCELALSPKTGTSPRETYFSFPKTVIL